MAKKLSSVLGIDIGSHSVKVAEVRMQGGRPVVTALGMARTPEGSVDHVGINDLEGTANSIREAINNAGASVGDAVVSVSGQGSVLVRTLEVPVMNESELKGHMEWEITRNIPFAESTVVSDFKAFPADSPQAKNMDVVMAIATQSSVDSLIAILKKAGRKPAAIDVEPLGLARALSANYEGAYAGRNVCVVEVGHKTTSINIYRDGRLLMPRQVPIGGELFTRAIADATGMSMSDAEFAKSNQAQLPDSAVVTQAPSFGAAPVVSYNPFADNPGDAPAPSVTEAMPAQPSAGLDPQAQQMYDALSPALEEFVGEVRRSIDYFRGKGGEVDAVLIAGGGSRIKNFETFLRSALAMPVERLDPTKTVSAQTKRGDFGDPAEYAVAIGTALHIAF